MSIEEIQNEIIEEFSMFDCGEDSGDSWTAKYEHLIEMAKELPAMDEKFKTEENIVRGCQSRVWLHAYQEKGNLKFLADSDALVTKGLVALMVRVLSDHKPSDISKAELFFIEKIGLREHLSPTRSNGLLAMIKQMKLYGLAFHQKQMD